MGMQIVQAVASHIYRTLRNSSMTVTNVVGPVEKMALANHPVKGIYYMTIGVPQVYNTPNFPFQFLVLKF
jgi:hypothetical protein